MPNYCI